MLIAWILAKMLGNWLFCCCCSGCFLWLAIWELSRRQMGSATIMEVCVVRWMLGQKWQVGKVSMHIEHLYWMWIKNKHFWYLKDMVYMVFLSLYGKLQYSCLVWLLSTYVKQRERTQTKDLAMLLIHFLHILRQSEAGKDLQGLVFFYFSQRACEKCRFTHHLYFDLLKSEKAEIK